MVLADWYPAMRDGLSRVDMDLPDSSVSCAFYGHLFRSRVTRGPGGDDIDTLNAYELELLSVWSQEADRLQSQRPPQRRMRGGATHTVQGALRSLSRSKFFATVVAQRALVGDLKQVSAYFHDDDVRGAVQACVVMSVSPETRVLVGHSLGAVVAYEALCAHPEWSVRTLVTVGAPLGIPNLIFDRLRPKPVAGSGAWPNCVVRWTNIADMSDIVALVKELRPLFCAPLEDHRVDNGATAHEVRPYLTAIETGRAIATGLSAQS
jgi:hypothetical protein